MPGACIHVQIERRDGIPEDLDPARPHDDMEATRQPSQPKVDSADLAVKEHCEVFPVAECNENCISKQLTEGHENMGLDTGESVKKPTLESHHNKTYEPEWDAALDDLEMNLN